MRAGRDGSKFRRRGTRVVGSGDGRKDGMRRDWRAWQGDGDLFWGCCGMPKNRVLNQTHASSTQMERTMMGERWKEGAQLNAGKEVVQGSCNAVAGVVMVVFDRRSTLLLGRHGQVNGTFGRRP